MADHLVAHGFARDRVHVIPPGIQPPSDASEEVARDPHLLLFVGALLRGKGLDILLHALPEIGAETRLSVVGQGHQESWLRQLATRLGVAHRVTFEGRQNSGELDAHYRRAACVVVPSRTPETFGLVGPEALLRGAPVVVSRVGGTGEWAKPEETALTFESGDVDGLARAVRAVLSDPARAARLADDGRRRVLEHYAPDTHLDALERVLRGARR
jgi:glycosyltransferase involved in cell wall biosynthesis